MIAFFMTHPVEIDSIWMTRLRKSDKERQNEKHQDKRQAKLLVLQGLNIHNPKF